MSRNKNGLIRKRNCYGCGVTTRNYRIVVKQEEVWSQKTREWALERTERPVCQGCLMYLDTTLCTKSPELEVGG